MGIFKKVRKFNVKKIECPHCHNDPKLKKDCIPCRGQGYVWIGK